MDKGPRESWTHIPIYSRSTFINAIIRSIYSIADSNQSKDMTYDTSCINGEEHEKSEIIWNEQAVQLKGMWTLNVHVLCQITCLYH